MSLLSKYHFDAQRFARNQARLAATPFRPELAHLSGPFVPLPRDQFVTVDDKHRALGEHGMGEVAFVLLNGGMATRFGGIAKGAAKALGDRSFLSLRIQQARQAAPHVPIVLMNSFATDAATRAHLAEQKHFGIPPDDIMICLQGIDQRLTPNGELYKDAQGEPSYYAPGHGDLPWALEYSGVGQKLRQRGIKTLFLSNVDNLGCTLDPVVLGSFLASGADMGVECVERTPQDVGGAPVKVNEQWQLVEGFRMPPSFDQSQLTGFNTNTFYFKWSALKPEYADRLEFHPVAKKVDGQTVVQFERIVGELTRHAPTAYLRVSRARFLPVKAPEDLQALQPILQQRYGA